MELDYTEKGGKDNILSINKEVTKRGTGKPKIIRMQTFEISYFFYPIFLNRNFSKHLLCNVNAKMRCLYIAILRQMSKSYNM